MVSSNLKRKKPEVTLSDRLFQEFPEAIAEERFPTDLELKRKIKELHEQGDREKDVRALVAYLEERPKILTRTQKIMKWVSNGLIVMVVLLAGYVGWWFVYGSSAPDPGYVVCRIGTVQYEGERCLVKDPDIKPGEETPAPKPPAVQPGTVDR